MALTAAHKIVTITKTWKGAAQGEFSNSYAVEGDFDLDNLTWLNCGKTLCQTEQKFLGTDVLIKSARIQYATGRNAQGIKEKPVTVGFGQYGLIPLNDTGFADGPTLPGQDLEKVLPAEICLAINFTAGRSGLSTHTYRHAIAESHWTCDGGQVKIKQALQDVVNHLWDEYLANYNVNWPMGVITGKGDTAIFHPVKEIKVAGARHVQLTRRRTGKKGDFNAEDATEKEATDPLGQAVEVLSDLNNDRYSTNGTALLRSAKVLGAISSIAGIAALLKAAVDSGDYGPDPVGN